jgi:hypothetical protein
MLLVQRKKWQDLSQRRIWPLAADFCQAMPPTANNAVALHARRELQGRDWTGPGRPADDRQRASSLLREALQSLVVCALLRYCD